MNFDLAGKTALVLGAGGGLGSAVATTLAREGAALALTDINEDALRRTENATTPLVRTVTRAIDLADVDTVRKTVTELERETGHIDIIVNLTGGPPPTQVVGQDPGDWERHFRAMVLSVITTADCLVPAMRQRGWGRVITSTSSGAVQPIANLGLSNTLRASLLGWSKTLANEAGPDGVTANIVIPGRIATQRTTALDTARAARENRPRDEVVAESTSSIPLRRYGRPEEFSNLVAFLASPRADYMTGASYRIDGGLVAGT